MGFNIHGLEFEVDSNNEQLLEYLDFRFKKYKNNNLNPSLSFKIFFWRNKLVGPEFDKISSTLYQKKNIFCIKYNNLTIFYKLHKGIWEVEAYFNPQKIRHIARTCLKGRKNTHWDYYEFFIVRKVIQNTFFSILEKTKMNVLHASCIKNLENSTLFFGLGGLGKTTLLLDLVVSKKLKSQGDNFVFIDSENVYSYLEPTRITKFTSQKVNLKGKLVGNKINTFGKKNFYLDENLLFNGKSKIKNIIFPRLSKKASLKKISQKEAIELIKTSMKILKETPEFSETSYFLKKKNFPISKKINFYKLSYTDLNDAKKLLEKIL